MGRRLIRLFVYEVYRRKLLDHKQLREMRYGMEVIYNEFIKMFALLTLFTLLGKLRYFLFSFTILVTIRCFSGGLHFHTNSSCLMFSVFFFITILALSIYMPIELLNYKGLILAFSTMTIGIFSPITNANRPIKNKKRRQVFKYVAVLFTAIWSYILLFHINDYGLVSYGIITVMLQAVQLVVSHILRAFKNNITGGGCAV